MKKESREKEKVESNSILEVVKTLIHGVVTTLCPPIHSAGWPFIVIFALVSLLASLIATSLGVIGLVVTLWCIYFFRDPSRTTPVRKGLVISPADGVVSAITKVPLPAELDPAELDIEGIEGDSLFKAKTVTRVSIFLNVFNVHVNRVPASGEITKVIYHAGKFLNATLDKASDENERCTVVMKLDNKKNSSIVFVQIAGMIARRILCDAKEGKIYKTGERYGIIRFGSRMDIYLPPRVMPQVSVGQTMIGGETVLADMDSSEKTREGEVR